MQRAHTGRGMVVRASLALVSVVALAIAGAAVGGRTLTSAVKLTTATATAHWSQGYLKPGANVTFAGSVGAASNLSAVLRPDDRPGVVTAKTDFAVATAGAVHSAHQAAAAPDPRQVHPQRLGQERHHDARSGQDRRDDPFAARGRARPGAGRHRAERAVADLPGRPPADDQGLAQGALDAVPVPTRRSGKNLQLVWKMKWHTVVGKVTKRYKDILETRSPRRSRCRPATGWPC